MNSRIENLSGQSFKEQMVAFNEKRIVNGAERMEDELESFMTQIQAKVRGGESCDIIFGHHINEKFLNGLNASYLEDRLGFDNIMTTSEGFIIRDQL